MRGKGNSHAEFVEVYQDVSDFIQERCQIAEYICYRLEFPSQLLTPFLHSIQSITKGSHGLQYKYGSHALVITGRQGGRV
jgi:hypothetical protein